MYIEGTIRKVYSNYQATVYVEELDFETPPLNVPQLWTTSKKSGCMPEEGSLVSAVLSDDMTYGSILGAIYNDVDKIPEEKEDTEFMIFEDGTEIYHRKDSKEFRIKGKLIVEGDIESTKDIKDKKCTMQDMRDFDNSHLHSNGNLGSNTGTSTFQI